MTEKEKMLLGKIYDTSDSEITLLREKAHRLCQRYNSTFESETELREKILDELIPNRAKGAALAGPIYFDYGLFTELGENFFANFNFTVLDTCPVKIGDNVMFGPNCTVATPVHPLAWQDRNIRFKSDGTPFDYEYAKPITVGSNCWIASGVIISGGVTIGEGSVIGAGSVVIRDIPPNTFAAGNPCRPIREITEKDMLKYHKELF